MSNVNQHVYTFPEEDGNFTTVSPPLVSNPSFPITSLIPITTQILILPGVLILDPELLGY